MKRFTHIPLIVSGENWQETSLERTVSLAKENQAEFTVTDVFEFQEICK